MLYLYDDYFTLIINTTRKPMSVDHIPLDEISHAFNENALWCIIIYSLLSGIYYLHIRFLGEKIRHAAALFWKRLLILPILEIVCKMRGGAL